MKTPVISYLILLIARTNEESVVTGLEIGSDDYIVKPFNLNILKAKIKTLIALREKFSRAITIQPDEVSVTPADEQFLKKIITFIEKNIDDPGLDILMLENELGMSKMTLYRKLTALTNLSGNAFIKNIRLKRAA